MSVLPDAVLAVLADAGALVDDTALRRAATAWSDDPWRIAVLGRTAVGKSTLINALLGHRALRTGLGGVTAEPVERIGPGGTVWIDTPGLDGPDRDAALALLPGADAAVWVVDGLQPMTSTERDALSALPRGLPLHVVVSRADRIDPAELPMVLERVAALSARWCPTSVRALDLRSAERQGSALPSDLATPAPWTSPRRRTALREALEGVRTALAALPPPPDREALAEALVARWRAVVREVSGPVEEAIRAGRIEHRAIASRWLVAAATPARDGYVASASVAPFEAPEALVLALPEASARGAVDVAGGLGGAGAALREIRAAAARWLADGEVAIREWVGSATGDPGRAAVRRRLAEAVTAALASLEPAPRPSGSPC